MNNNTLLSLALTLIPILSITFVGIVLLHKIYFKIRSRYKAKVNCWFCNHDTKVPFVERNCWTCPQCEQYNGFTKDGNYNREIYEQLDCSNLNKSKQRSQQWLNSTPPSVSSQTPSNGFCEACNEAQRLKVEKLAQFEPKNEARFDQELKVFKEKLEEQYRLCETCNRHLSKVLREKKRMIIGSKFLEFILKGAKRFKEPYLIQVREHIHEKRKQRLNRLAIFLTLLNIICLLKLAPILKREQVTNLFGENLGTFLFVGLSHIYATGRVLLLFIEELFNFDFIGKMKLFIQTLGMMLMYSLGLRLPANGENSFHSLYIGAYPFMLLVLALVHNVLDSLKFNRFTYLLISWSLFAGGLFENQDLMEPQTLMFLNTFLTLILTLNAKYLPSGNLLENSSNSFRKIYAEDYLSDEDTISLLSEQIDRSNVSMKSSDSMSFSCRSPTATTRTNLFKPQSPLTSSTFSLNNFNKKQISPNSSFQKYQYEMTTARDAMSVDGGFDTNQSSLNFLQKKPFPNQNVFGSNIELNTRPRPASTLNLPQHNSFLNQSFTSTRSQQAADPFSSSASFAFPNNKANESFYSQNNNGLVNPNGLNANQTLGANQSFQRNFCVAPALFSPLSLSSNALYQQDRERASNLLTPSRFSTNCLNNNGSSNINAWLHDPINSPHTSLYNAKDRNVFGMKDLEENLSRTSSHSSGFESQPGLTNFSRENSCHPENHDILQRSCNLDSNNMSFRPVQTPLDLTFITNNQQPNNLPQVPYHNLPCPNNLNNLTSLHHRRNGTSSSSYRDSFNLNKINEELPQLRKGDLLRKWQESQNL